MQPLYQQVKRYVTERITAGDWVEGERVPSENDLVRTLGTSRMTVNRALRELTDQGVLNRTAGVGTFVAPARLQRPAQLLKDIAEEIKIEGRVHSARVLSQQSDQASESLAAMFERKDQSQLFHALVVHRADGSPWMLEDRWVNPLVAPGYLEVDLSRITTTRYLLEAAPVQRVQQTVEAITVNSRAAAILELATYHPVLLVRRRTWARDQVASYAQLYYPGSRYRLAEWADDMPRVSPAFKNSQKV